MAFSVLGCGNVERGYTKRWRKRWEKNYHKDRLLWVLMDYFIDHANYQDVDIYLKGVGSIPLKRGQHVFGTVKLARFIGVDRQRIRTKLTILKNIGFLTIKTTNKYSIASIINYNTYNPLKTTTNQQNDHQLTSSKPATNQQLTTDNKDNKVKKDKNIYKNIVEHLNQKTGKNYKYNSKETIRLINSRLNCGFTEQDFYTVINNKCATWMSDVKMIEFLRPQTLFGTKFETYLQDISRKPQELKPTTYSQAKDAEGRAMAKWVKGQKDEECNPKGTRQIPAKLP